MTVTHPETISDIERNDRVLNEYLRTTLSQVLNWNEYLRCYSFAYNTTPTTSHRFTPLEVFGRNVDLLGV